MPGVLDPPRRGHRFRPLARVVVWVATPFRLLRFPAVLVAVFGSVALIAVAAGAAPLFVSAGGSAALNDRIGVTSTGFAGLKFTSSSPISPDRLVFRQRLVQDASRGLPLGKPAITVIGSRATLIGFRSGRSRPVQMLTREGFLRWIKPLSGSPSAAGFWISQTAAEAAGVKAGQRAVLELGAARATIRVAGIYRDLIDDTIPAFWSPVLSLIVPFDTLQPPLPKFILGDPKAFTELESRLLDRGTFEFDLPLRSGLTLSQARSSAARAELLQGKPSDPVSPLSATFDSIDSGLPALVDLAEQTVGATTQPVQAISLAGRLVALVMVGAAGVYGIRRRRVEFDLLSARGLGPWRLGLRNTVEALLPSALGAAFGWVLAVYLVKALGPSAASDPSALRDSFVQAALSAAFAVLLFGFVAGAATKNEARERPGRLRETATRWPWEIAALALAAASLYEIITRGSGAVDLAARRPPKFDLLILLFPFLFVAGFAGLAVRWARRMLPKLKAASSKRSVWMYLSASRLASAPRLATSLVTASALALGILSYAGVLASSVEATATEKASLSIGSDVVMTVGSLPTVLGKPGFEWTPVERFPKLQTIPGDQQADVLAIDPSTFAQTAYWNTRLGGSLSEMVGGLRSNGSPLPVIVVGPAIPPDLELLAGGRQVALRMVARVEHFPGAARGQLTVVADRSTLEKSGLALSSVETRYELWAKGDPAQILPVLRRQQFPVELAATAAQIRATPAFLALSWTFGLLQAFGILAGLITLLGVLLYLQARQQAREISYALARRMGLSRGAHRRSVLVELLAMLLSAFVLGALFSTVAAGLVHGRLDPIPALPPGPLLAVPRLMFGVTALGIIVVCALGAELVQRRADRTRVAEVMRLAG